MNGHSSKIVFVMNDIENPMVKTMPTAFLKTIATDDKSNYNVVSQYTFGFEG
jgi:hypothetical protein